MINKQRFNVDLATYKFREKYATINYFKPMRLINFELSLSIGKINATTIYIIP